MKQYEKTKQTIKKEKLGNEENQSKKRNKGRKPEEDFAKEYDENAKEETRWKTTAITLLWKRKLPDLVYTPNSNQSDLIARGAAYARRFPKSAELCASVISGQDWGDNIHTGF
jgi:hypothetical protein